MVSHPEEKRRCRPARLATQVPRLTARAAAGRVAYAFAAVLLVGLAAGPVGAATFPDLYTVMVTVAPGESSSRAEVQRRAMSSLLTRVTGARDAASDPELQQALVSRVDDYVDAYGMLEPGRFRVGFNAAAVERQLRALGRPTWGPERPLTLLWIAVDRGLGERAILSEGGLGGDLSPEMAETLAVIREDLLTVANERGLPVAFPLLDLEDMSALGFGDIWGGFDDRVELASRRYDADAVLVGRLLHSEFGAEVHWTLLWNGQRSFMVGRSGSDGLDWAADFYAGELSTVGRGVRDVYLTVLDVTSLRDYGRVMRYLEQASVLESVDVESHDLEDGALRLRVTARGEPGVLERVLGLGGVLAAAGADGNGLVFRVAR